MSNIDLSVLIPARNEEYLSRTVEGILANIRGKTEIIIALDGAWSDPGIPDDPRVTIIYFPESIGQRAATNQAARLAKGRYFCKLDAHCIVSEGFDTALVEAGDILGDDVVQIPTLINLHVFDWICNRCGNRWYQSPTPLHCMMPGESREINTKCDNTTDFTKEIIWKPRFNRKSTHYRFDTTMHFQYHRDWQKRAAAENPYTETMSAQGSCFVVSAGKYWQWNICDEKHGSWGQQGTEVACKAWLSGGRLVTNKLCWYSHLFRTQGGDFGFPYPQDNEKQEFARQYSRDLWMNNKWEGQVRPLSWLIDKFYPQPDWHAEEHKQLLAKMRIAGQEFYELKGIDVPKTKGLVYYTDNQLNIKISKAVKRQILKTRLPVTSVSLKPIDFGNNTVVNLQRGWEAYFTQILTGLENAKEDVIFFTEHDWLYHPSHFDFTPKQKDTFYYNWNWWRVRASDGLAVKYDTQLVPGICAYRELLLEYYTLQYNFLKAHNFDADWCRKTGFEPGTHNRIPELSGYRISFWSSEFPNIDIRHTNNLTSSKWSPDAFRSPRNAKNWQVSQIEKIPGWPPVSFEQLLSSI